MTSSNGRCRARYPESFFQHTFEIVVRTSLVSLLVLVHEAIVSDSPMLPVCQGHMEFDSSCIHKHHISKDDDIRFGIWHSRRELTEKMRPLLRAAAAIPPLALRGDYWAPVTLLPYLVDALRHAGPGVQVIVCPLRVRGAQEPAHVVWVMLCRTEIRCQHFWLGVAGGAPSVVSLVHAGHGDRAHIWGLPSKIDSTEPSRRFTTFEQHGITRLLAVRLLCREQALQGAFTDVLEGTVKRDSFLFKWLDYLSFALR